MSGAALVGLMCLSVMVGGGRDRDPQREATRPHPSDAPSAPRAPRGPESFVIGAAGDIACETPPRSDPASSVCRYDTTSDLLIGVDHVLALGDNQYPDGDLEVYRRRYGPTWGRFRAVTSPVPGNHEYLNAPGTMPSGYLGYFGDRVLGPGGLGSYSFDLPPGCTPGTATCWHVIAIASELCMVGGGCGRPREGDLRPGARLFRWLERDLASHPNAQYPCTLAFWHHPLFSFSSGSGASAAVRPLWELLYRARAEVVLNGHSHNYQRWDPLDPSGAPDPGRGIREFVVGTGGVSLYELPDAIRPAGLAAAQDEAFGILRLTLRPTSYAWAWLGVDGGPDGFSDVAPTDASCR
jgi:hypothetical protein